MGQKKQWHIPCWNMPSLEPRSVKAREGGRGDDALALADATKTRLVPSSNGVRIVYLYCNFCLIIVASGDRFAFCGQLRIFFPFGFWFFGFFGYSLLAVNMCMLLLLDPTLFWVPFYCLWGSGGWVLPVICGVKLGFNC